MNEGVQILLERMKTHPEEFVPEYDGGVTKWGSVIGQYKTYLTKEDCKALDDAWKETVVTAMQQKFTERVLEELVDPKADKGKYGDSVLDAQVYAQQAQATQAHIQLHQQQLAMQAQAAQQVRPGSIYDLGAGQGLLGSLFGGGK
jgi:hypothetical protein